MKKLFTMLLVAGSLAVSACGATMYSSKSAESNLKGKGYSAEVLSPELAKVKISGLNYDIVSFTDAVYAEKGSGEDMDFLMAFFFKSIGDADKFMDGNNNENMGLLSDYADKHLGANLTKKVGIHNNVAYVGSETSFAAVFQ